jgi:hypothetical protein
MDDEMTGAGAEGIIGTFPEDAPPGAFKGEAPSCFIVVSNDSGAPVIFVKSRIFV